MRSFKVVVILLATLTLFSIATGQRPMNTTICDYYTNVTFGGNDTAANQYLLLTILVNTVVIGNYTTTPLGLAVPGILAPATVGNETVNLAPYFTGAMNTTNVNGMAGMVNFLDGGGATPLTENKPSNDSATCASNQCQLLTHLYQAFGYLLGCSAIGTAAFPAYAGDSNLYETHKFMALDNAETTYFIGQVGLAAKAFGVSTADVTAVGTALTTIFGQQCSPPVKLGTDLAAEPQNICIESDCPVSATPNCTAYGLTSANTGTNSSSNSTTSSTASPPPGMTSGTTSSPPPPSSSAPRALSTLVRAGGVGGGLILGALIAVLVL